MAFDIRLPVGLLFILIGSILVGYGALGPALGTLAFGRVDVNVGWGAVLVVFGVSMLLLAQRQAVRLKRAKTRAGG